MAKKNEIPSFFSLPQSKRVSFKVKSKKSNQKLYNSDFLDIAIPPREDYQDRFDINENSTDARPRTFTPEQIYNYKSNWQRYQKGMEIAEDGKVLKDPSNNDKYKIPSPKAPKGYWEVEREKEHTRKVDGRVFAYCNVSATFTSFNSGSFDSKTAFTPEDPAIDLIFADDFEAAGKISGEYSSTVNSSVGSEYATVHRSADRLSLSGQVLSDAIEDVGASSITINLNFKSKGYIEQSEIIFTIETNLDLSDSRNSFSCPGYPEITQPGIYSIIKDSEPQSIGLSVVLGYNQTDIDYFLSLTINSIRITNPPPDDENGGNKNSNDQEDSGDSIQWKCNCPDSSKKRDPSPTSTTPSNEAPQDWTDSDAGAQGEVCKHIWAVRIVRGEISSPEDIPHDVPIDPTKPASIKNSTEARVIGGNGGIGFPNWNSNKQVRRKDA